MKLGEIQLLTENKIKELVNLFSTMTYSKTSTVIHSGHVPHIGFIIVQGTAILKSPDSEHILGRGAIIGIKEIYLNTIMSCDVILTAETSVIALDKSTLTDTAFQSSLKTTDDSNLLNNIILNLTK